MKVVINHLTRVQPGYICVAGIDIETNRHVRPVLSGQRLGTRMLLGKGGFFDLGQLVDLGKVEYVGQAPELEDYHFDPAKVTRMGKVSPARFWQFLQKNARPTLTEIFGPDLKSFGRGAGVARGCGQASLGCLKLSRPPELYLDDQQKIRIAFSDGLLSVDLSVTDLRFYEEDYKTPKKELVEQAAALCRASSDIILSVGLSRAWAKPGDHTERHWLQMNNIFFRDDPGRLFN